MFRKLRIVAACCCFVGSIGLSIVWLRSHDYCGRVSWTVKVGQPIDQLELGFYGTYAVGKCYVRLQKRRSFHQARFSWSETPADEYLAAQQSARRWIRPQKQEVVGYNFKHDCAEVWMDGLFWPPVLLGFLVSILLKPSPRLRFALQDVFVLTTIVALAVGGIAATFRYAT